MLGCTILLLLPALPALPGLPGLPDQAAGRVVGGDTVLPHHKYPFQARMC